MRERERAERGREELKKSKVDLGIRFQKSKKRKKDKEMSHRAGF